MNLRTSPIRLSVLALGLAALAPQAGAEMALTSGATTAGFALTTFATGFPLDGNIGPLGIAFSGGSVIVSDYPGNVRVFSTDADGQSATSFPVAHNYGSHNAIGLASAGGAFYMTAQAAGNVMQINPDGTFNQMILPSLPSATGIVSNPANGHLFVSTGGFGAVVDINPITKTSSIFKNISADGLTTDGVTLYAETNNSIIGYRLSDGAQVFNSGSIGDGPDGTALGTGSLAGEIFVNTNGGRLLEYNLTGTPVATLIGTGGTRGDFVTVDPNGTLLLTQSDRILRLAAPQGGGFGTPEPGTLALLGSFGVVASLLRRRRK